jgi:aminopeptidase N
MKNLFVSLSCLLSLSLSAQLSFNSNASFGRADSLRGNLSWFRTCYDVTKYDLDISVDLQNKAISGSNTISFNVLSDFNKMQIDLFANMKIDKIMYGQKELRYTREFNAVFISFPEKLDKGQKKEITVFYSGNPQVAKQPPWDGGFSWGKDPDNNDWVGVSCQGTGASLWWPCKDHQSDEPLEMWIRTSVPAGYMNVSNGRLMKQSTSGQTTKYEWYVSNPINNYDVTLNIAKYAHFSDVYINPEYKDTLSLDYYVLPAFKSKAEKQFEQVKPMMDCYYKMFGEYPFVKDGYKLVQTSYLGMEHQSAVAYGNNFKQGYLGSDLSGSGYGLKFDYIIIHESGHEWWGNSVTTNDIADMWVHEGFTQYAEALYVEHMWGHDAYLKYVNGLRSNIANDIPLIGHYHVNNEGSGDMYPKGALLIHTLRSVIDDDKLFFTILKEIQSKFKHKTINSSDIEEYFSSRTGLALQPFFDLYLRTTEIPVLDIRLAQAGTGVTVEYKWKTKETRSFDMPVKVTLKKDEYAFIFPTTSWQTITIPGMDWNQFKVATQLFLMDVNLTQKIKR